MSIPFEPGIIPIEELMSSEFTKLESKIQKRNNINLYGGIIGVICLLVLYFFLLLVLPSVIYYLSPSIGVEEALALSNYIIFLVIAFLIFVMIYYISKRIPVVYPIQALFYYCYKISNLLEEYLKDEDPSSLIESIKAIKKINEELTKVKVNIMNVPILRHNSDYREFLKLKSLFRNKVKHRLRPEAEKKDIEILKSAFDMLSHFFYDDKVESSTLSVAIEDLEKLEDRPFRIFGLSHLGNLIKRGIYSDNRFIEVIATFLVVLIVMLLISGVVCFIVSLYGMPLSDLIPIMIGVSFGGAAVLSATITTLKQRI